jgi:hypothetical protein
MGSPDSRILYAKVDSSVAGDNITWREKIKRFRLSAFLSIQ